MDPKKKFFLFKQSNVFCSVPWNHFELFTDGTLKTCSKGKSLGNINEQSIHKLLQSTAIKDIKHDLVNEKYNDNCKRCHYLTTDNEHYDLRNHYNPMFKQFDIDYNNISAFDLHAIDLHWDNTCNFKCIYCNPQQSSSIAHEQQAQVIRTNQQHIDEIIDLIVVNQYQMKEIYLSGGEPLLIKHNAKLLRKISNTDLPIRINSNISYIGDTNPVYTELKRFKNVLWTVSAEAQGSRFNYIRNGGNWQDFKNQLEEIKQIGHQIRVNSVFFIAAAVDIFDTIEYFVTKHQISDFTINQIVNMPILQVRNAPESVKQQSLTRMKQLLDSGLIVTGSNSWYNIARCQKELELPAESKEYKTYFDKLDQLRNTDWRTLFPELDV